MIHKAQQQPKRVVFPEGDEDKILRAAQILMDERIARADSAGQGDARFASGSRTCGSNLDSAEIINPGASRARIAMPKSSIDSGSEKA